MSVNVKAEQPPTIKTTRRGELYKANPGMHRVVAEDLSHIPEAPDLLTDLFDDGYVKVATDHSGRMMALEIPQAVYDAKEKEFHAMNKIKRKTNRTREELGGQAATITDSTEYEAGEIIDTRAPH